MDQAIESRVEIPQSSQHAGRKVRRSFSRMTELRAAGQESARD